jgi:hypothetical protein
MLSVDTSNRPLKATSLKTLHPNGDSIGIPIQELDPVEAMVQEHEQAPIAHVAMEVVLDNPKKTVEALAHIDRFGMQVDGDRRIESEHDD